MSDFLNTVQEITKKRLALQKQETDEEIEKIKKDFEDEIQKLQDKFDRLQNRVKNQKKKEKVWKKEQQYFFTLEKEKESLVRRVYDEVTKEYFSQDKNVTEWIQKNLKQIEREEGTITAGASVGVIKKAMKNNTRWKIVESKDMDNEHGFIFESDSRYYDTRISNMLDEVYQSIRQSIYQLVDNTDV